MKHGHELHAHIIFMCGDIVWHIIKQLTGRFWMHLFFLNNFFLNLFVIQPPVKTFVAKFRKLLKNLSVILNQEGTPSMVFMPF